MYLGPPTSAGQYYDQLYEHYILQHGSPPHPQQVYEQIEQIQKQIQQEQRRQVEQGQGARLEGKEGGEESDPLVGPMEPPGLALTLSPPWTEAALHLGRPELRVAVGHTVSLLLDIAEREKNRQLRLDALDALLGLCCNVHNPDTLACFFPGISEKGAVSWRF